MKYSGIDLHSNNSVVTVTDEEDRVIAEKRLPKMQLVRSRTSHIIAIENIAARQRGIKISSN